MFSSDFHWKENDEFHVVPVHPGLVISDYGAHEVGVTVCGLQHVLWVMDVRVRPGTCYFPYNENPTRALNSIPLKCCLSSTDAIERREKFTHAYEGSRSAHRSALHWNQPGFWKKKKVWMFFWQNSRPTIFIYICMFLFVFVCLCLSMCVFEFVCLCFVCVFCVYAYCLVREVSLNNHEI